MSRRLRRLLLVCTSLLVIMWPLCPFAALAAGPTPIVGPRIRVSPPRVGYHALVDLAIDRDQPKNIVACGNRYSIAENATIGFVYVSNDGGRSWREALKDDSSNWVTEESCASGAGGKIVFMAESQRLQHGKALTGVPLDKAGDLHLYSSLDRGHRWKMLTRHEWLDSTAMTIDSSHGPRRGRMYLFGADKGEGSNGAFSQIQLVTSDDGRNIYGPISSPKPSGFRYLGAYASGARMLPNHEAVAVYMTRRRITNKGENRPFETHVEVFAARNGGKVLQSVADLGIIQPCIGAMPALDVNRTTGSIYVVWGNLQNGRCQLEIAYSVGGHKWSSPRRITVTRDGFDPAIAVNDKGVIGLFWLETTLGTSLSHCWRFSASLDNGTTFSSPVQVSRCEPTSRRAALSCSVYASPDVHVRRNGPGWDIDPNAVGFSAVGARDGMLPWRTGLATDPSGRFHAVWPEMTDQAGALWSAVITVGTSANATSASHSATDISPMLALELSNSEFDQASGIYSLDVTAANIGTHALKNSICLLLDDFYSKFFTAVRVVGSDNRMGGKGARWKMWPGDGGDLLQPGKRTAPRRLSFRLSSRAPNPVAVGDLLAVKMKAFSEPGDCLWDDGPLVSTRSSNRPSDPPGAHRMAHPSAQTAGRLKMEPSGPGG